MIGEAAGGFPIPAASATICRIYPTNRSLQHVNPLHNRTAMSVKVMGRVWDAALKPNLKIVLLAYADAAEHDGTEIWPGWERIATMTGYSAPTVARLTAELLTHGVLVQVSAGHTGHRATYLIDLTHPILRVYQDDIQSEPESLSGDVESVSNDAESLSPVIPLPSSTSVLTSRPIKKRDELWEVFTAIHGQPATKSERGKFNRIVKTLKDADVTATEYPSLVQGWVTKHNLQPAVATVSERVGEIRQYIDAGPVQPLDVKRIEHDQQQAWVRQQLADIEDSK